MAKRPKIYYPEYQITKGLFTAGKEWMLRDTKKEYVGPYHTYTDGIVMSGGSYSTSNSEYLVPYEDTTKQPEKTIYDTIRKNEDITKYESPTTYYPFKSLTVDDYKREYITRYFVKRRNDPNSRIIEVTEKQYNSLPAKSSGINGDLYFGISLRWRIAGNLNTTSTTYGIVDANKKTLQLSEEKMSGIANFLGDLQEFSIYNKLTDNSIRNEILKDNND